jgi:hypothetical protein
MRAWVLLTLGCTLAAAQLRAAEPPRAHAGDGCLMLNNRVLGPRKGDRPLPLLSGDPTHGLHPACTVPWSALSPHNQALPVTDCFRRSLLKVANDSACGSGTGPLWVDARWVVTSADLRKPLIHAATCEQLETGTWAGTRAFSFDCVPRKKALHPETASPAAASPAAASPAAAPPAAAPPAAPTSGPHQ